VIGKAIKKANHLRVQSPPGNFTRQWLARLSKSDTKETFIIPLTNNKG